MEERTAAMQLDKYGNVEKRHQQKRLRTQSTQKLSERTIPVMKIQTISVWGSGFSLFSIIRWDGRGGLSNAEVSHLHSFPRHCTHLFVQLANILVSKMAPKTSQFTKHKCAKKLKTKDNLAVPQVTDSSPTRLVSVNVTPSSSGRHVVPSSLAHLRISIQHKCCTSPTSHGWPTVIGHMTPWALLILTRPRPGSKTSHKADWCFACHPRRRVCGKVCPSNLPYSPWLADYSTCWDHWSCRWYVA